MNTGLLVTSEVRNDKKMALKRGKITVFHCFNAVTDISVFENGNELKSIKLPCSGMINDKILLKAFEDGADAVIVFGCSEATCHYLQGSLRARKRVEHVKKLLDEAGLDGGKLSFYNIKPEDDTTVREIIDRTAASL